MSDEQLYKTLALAKSLGVITTAHCENADLVAELQKKLLARRQDRARNGTTGAVRRRWKRKVFII